MSGQSPSTFGLFVGILNSSGPLPREKTRIKEIAIGFTKVLRMLVFCESSSCFWLIALASPDLSDHHCWEPAHIMSPIDSAGRDRMFSEFINSHHPHRVRSAFEWGDIVQQ